MRCTGRADEVDPPFFGHAFRVCQAGNQAGEVSGMEEHRRASRPLLAVDGIHSDGFRGRSPSRAGPPGRYMLYLLHEGRPEVQEGQDPPVAGGEGDPPATSPTRIGGPPELRFQIGKGRLSPGRGEGCQDQGLRLFIGHRGDIAAGRVSAYRPGELP